MKEIGPGEKENLEHHKKNNDIRGIKMTIKKEDRMIYQNIHTKQMKGVTKAFDQFFIKEQFDTVIELGTGNGGFTLYIAEKCNEMKANFYTFDIRQIISSASLKKLKQFGGTFFKEDTNKTDRIKNFIKDDGRILILNDGDKINSFNIYCHLLKLDDYMFIHDYYYKIPSIFDGVGTWEDFENGLVTYNLSVSNYTKMFEKYLWMCIKK
jgi:cephalosporin hydroxylase